MARERRTESVLAWGGVGTVAGALLLAVVTMVLHRSGQDTGVFETAGWGWFWACVVGGFVLTLGVRLRPVSEDEEPDAESGWDYVLFLAGAALVTALIAGHGVLLGTETEEFGGLTTSELRMGIVVCAVALGLLLMLSVVRRPLLPPLTRSLPSFGAGVLAVVVAGTTVPLLVEGPEGTGVRHVVAEDLPEAATVPDRVRRVGWAWELEQSPEPGREVEFERIARGAHGPLMVLSDGVVSLDGTDGTEIWSYRRPAEEKVSVWTGHGKVYVTHTPVADGDTDDDREPDPVTEEFDWATGELRAEYDALPQESEEEDTGALIGWSDGVRYHHDWRAGRSWDDPSGMSAWDGETGEEQWYQPLTPEKEAVCGRGRTLMRADTVVYAVVCVSEDDVYEQRKSVRDLVLGGDVHTEFRVVSVDLRTGREKWSYEREGWEDAFLPGRLWVAHGAGDAGDALVVLEGEAHGLLLVPDTGEELMHVTDDLVEFDEEWSAREILDADGDGLTLRYDHRDQGTGVYRVDTAGKSTELVGAGGVNLQPGVRGARLHEQYLFPENADSAYENPSSVLVAKHGERFGAGLDNRIVLGSGGEVGRLLDVPGGVVAEVSARSGGVRVEGLVP